MRNDSGYAAGAAVALLAFCLAAPQPADAAGKIVCWKDASGKTIGCGDTVPPEYRGAATKELDSRGVTRKTNVSAEEAAMRRESEREAARKKAEEEQRLAEQRRQDAALIATFSNTREIDAKADREVQILELHIGQQRNILKGVGDRLKDMLARKEKLEAGKQPVPQALQDDIARVAGERDELEQSVTAKEREIAEVRRRYAEMKERYTALRGGGSGTPAKK